jgi:hypothetical protein
LTPPLPRNAALLAGLILSAAIPAAGHAASLGHASTTGLPAVTIEDVRVVEGNAGVTAAVFTVRLSQEIGAPGASVDFATESRSAEAGSDFAPVSGTLSFNETGLVYTIQVDVFGDSLVEGNEHFALRLLNPSPEVELADSVALCTIVNDEPPRFTEIPVGLTTSLTGMVASAFADADRDHDPDLPTDRYAGGSQFVPMPDVLGELDWGDHHGSAWCDYDRDGWPDLVVVPYATENTVPVRMNLFHNLGLAGFGDVAASLGMNLLGNGETAVWGDFDGDGWPDLFVPFYAHVAPYRSFLYRNLQNGRFAEMALEAGVALQDLPESLKPEGADAVDWDGNGTLDLYCASHLFLNDGTGHFTDVREQVGLPQMFDEGARFVDVDGDGDFDLYLRSVTGPRLFRNDQGTFVDITTAAGFTGELPFYSGDSWADVDNDGDLDLLYANPPGVPATLWLNRGDGTFVPDPEFSLENHQGGISAWADVDDDGDLDTVMGEFHRTFLSNQIDQSPTASRTLRVWVLEADSTLVSFGATARLYERDGGPGTIQTRTVDGGGGYLTQSEYPLHFAGLGNGHYSLDVRYPGSTTTATVIDGTVNPLLADFTLEQLPYPNLFVFRDGRVTSGPSRPEGAVGVGDVPGAGSSAIGRPWPLPARRSATIPLLRTGGGAHLTIHDATGRRVRELLADGTVPRTPVVWDLRSDHGELVPSGIYFARLTIDGHAAGVRRLVVLR